MENRRAVTIGGTYRRRADYRRLASPKYNREMSGAGSRLLSTGPFLWSIRSANARTFAERMFHRRAGQNPRTHSPESRCERTWHRFAWNTRGTGARGLSQQR